VVTVAEADNTQPETGNVLKFASKKDKKAERVLLFTIDDEEYTVPAKPGMASVMRYLNVARKSGNDLFAAQALVEDMLGEDKWEKFLNWEGHSEDETAFNTVIEKCINLAVSSVEDTQAK
jgi:hypothetical protein